MSGLLDHPLGSKRCARTFAEQAQWDSVLEGDGDGEGEAVHEARNGGTFLAILMKSRQGSTG